MTDARFDADKDTENSILTDAKRDLKKIEASYRNYFADYEMPNGDKTLGEFISDLRKSIEKLEQTQGGFAFQEQEMSVGTQHMQLLRAILDIDRQKPEASQDKEFQRYIINMEALILQSSIVELLDNLLKTYKKEPKKSLLTRCRNIIFHAEQGDDIYTAFKIVLSIALQQRWQSKNTSSLADNLIKLLNTSQYLNIRERLFSYEEPVSYDWLRKQAFLPAEAKEEKPMKFFAEKSRSHFAALEKGIVEMERKMRIAFGSSKKT